ncbi:hypothetical protein J6590_019674 [Homalodisca vitripennis]|nr:hypothetical protein J6590_019674 [Homalodisca vitripennis]
MLYRAHNTARASNKSCRRCDWCTAPTRAKLPTRAAQCKICPTQHTAQQFLRESALRTARALTPDKGSIRLMRPDRRAALGGCAVLAYMRIYRLSAKSWVNGAEQNDCLVPAIAAAAAAEADATAAAAGNYRNTAHSDLPAAPHYYNSGHVHWLQI